MAKLSGPMIRALRAIAGVPGTRVHPRTMEALYARSLITDGANGPAVTQDGAHELVKADHAEREAAYQAGKAKPEPLATGRGDNGIGMPTPEDSGPSVRLTPAPADTKREATDAEVLQLLAVLDAGEIVHRALYQGWGVLDAPFTLNLDAVNRAARDAVRFGLVRQTFKDREYVLTAEPVHLDAGKGYTACGWSTVASAVRLRVTSDPAKVTHERCK